MKKVEAKVNDFLNHYPNIKKIIKRLYQRVMYFLSNKKKFEGNLIRVTPQDEYEYFYGYYDTSPWDANDRYLLALRVKSTTKSVSPSEPAEIILIDTIKNNALRVLGKTYSWNNQQGCMLQWLGPNFDKEVIYNDFREGHHCSVIKNIWTGQERIIDYPIYAVSSTGKFALTLDFSRLHRLRPGYGYANLKDQSTGDKLPSGYCISKIDIENNTLKGIIKYKDIYEFEHREVMEDAEHKVNHIMISPDSERFMFLHRWKTDKKRYSRLITSDIDGKNLYNLSDCDMVSHCFWKSNTEIIGFMKKNPTGNGYYILEDQTTKYRKIIPELVGDGHPSFHPKRRAIITDSYPDRTRMSKVFIYEENNLKELCSVFSPFKYDNDFRCDLHPRWNRKGDEVCIDSVFEGKRGIYVVSLNKQVEK